MKPIETIEYKGYKINIHVDECGINPREEFDNFGTMLCKHKRYNLGDVKESAKMSAEEILEYVKRKDVLSLGLYLYDHSGLYLKCSSNGNPWMGRLPQGHAEWDSGLVGFITVTHQRVKGEMARPKKLKKGQINPDLSPIKHLSKKDIQRAIHSLECEVETYAQYLNGDTYGYTIENLEDSCWGFYGSEWEENGLLESAQDAIDCEITRIEEEKRQEIDAQNTLGLEIQG